MEEYLITYRSIISHPRIRGQMGTADPRTLVVAAADKAQAFCTAYDHLVRAGHRLRFNSVNDGNWRHLLTDEEWQQVLAAGVPREVSTGWGCEGDLTITEIALHNVRALGHVKSTITPCF